MRRECHSFRQFPVFGVRQIARVHRNRTSCNFNLLVTKFRLNLARKSDEAMPKLADGMSIWYTAAIGIGWPNSAIGVGTSVGVLVELLVLLLPLPKPRPVGS